MMSNRLQLNTTKTEVTWCASARRQHQLPMNPLSVGNVDIVEPVSSVCDLGIHLDADPTTLSCGLTSRKLWPAVLRFLHFAVLRGIRSIRRSVSPSVLRSIPRLDYGCATLGWLGCLVSYLTGSSRCSMMLYG